MDIKPEDHTRTMTPFAPRSLMLLRGGSAALLSETEMRCLLRLASLPDRPPYVGLWHWEFLAGRVAFTDVRGRVDYRD